MRIFKVARKIDGKPSSTHKSYNEAEISMNELYMKYGGKYNIYK